MPRFIAITLLLFCTSFVQSQMSYLFVKKGGQKKKIYVEEDRIILQLKNGTIYRGLITHLKDDTIFINGKPLPVASVKAVIIHEESRKSFRLSGRTILLITGGVALTTIGLTASKQAKFKEALTAGLVIGYAPVAVYYIGSKISFRRKKYIIGKKFHLQVLDFHLPASQSF
ncbi:MAG: hypothetical protein JST17_06445 [Bacteroidetes bacterium]|nr:hypothetical protein [Bacteroidota bacterium]MBS1929801.1 hypothetical protein [Bacteroidota bacterium]